MSEDPRQDEPYHDHTEDYDDCPYCGGEGWTWDCIDGCCEDADIGCDACERRCEYCNPVKAIIPAFRP